MCSVVRRSVGGISYHVKWHFIRGAVEPRARRKMSHHTTTAAGQGIGCVPADEIRVVGWYQNRNVEGTLTTFYIPLTLRA